MSDGGANTGYFECTSDVCCLGSGLRVNVGYNNSTIISTFHRNCVVLVHEVLFGWGPGRGSVPVSFSWTGQPWHPQKPAGVLSCAFLRGGRVAAIFSVHGNSLLGQSFLSFLFSTLTLREDISECLRWVPCIKSSRKYK